MDQERSDHEAERLRERRTQWQVRHSRALARLMAEREDLRGLLPLADVVDEGLRWTA